MDVKKILADIKAAFNAAPAVLATPPIPPATVLPPTVVCYPVSETAMGVGGDPVYVDVSDDGVADIDSGDLVYTDSALTTPYPDGTYNVTGTTFGFTVASGAVSAVTDPDATGPGTPMPGDGSMAITPPVTTPVPPAPTLEERVAALENKLAQPAQMSVQKPEVSKADLTALEQAFEKKYGKTINDLFDLVEKIGVEPTADPVTLTGPKKEKFDKISAKNARIERIADHIGKNRTKTLK